MSASTLFGTSSIARATVVLLILAGCNRADRDASAGGDLATDSAATLSLDQADDRIEDALRADAELGAFRLDADDEGERVVLEGTVATEAQKTRAAEIAAGAAPGISIENQLRVNAGAAEREAAHEAADEADDRVEDALDADTTLRAFDLDADDEDGRLILTGDVRTAEQRTLAEDIARRVAPGVPIDNRIRVE